MALSLSLSVSDLQYLQSPERLMSWNSCCSKNCGCDQLIGGYGMNRITGVFAKIGLVLLGTFGGMFSGAVIVYFLAGVIYQMVYSGVPIDPMHASEACARGMAVGYLSILGGTLLGTVLGGAGTLNYIANRKVANSDAVI